MLEQCTIVKTFLKIVLCYTQFYVCCHLHSLLELFCVFMNVYIFYECLQNLNQFAWSYMKCFIRTLI